MDSKARCSRKRVLGALAALVTVAAAGCSSGQVTSSTAASSPSPVTSTAAPAGTAASGTPGLCVTSAAKGSCGPYLYQDITPSNGRTTTVGQNVWNPISGWSQQLHASNPGDWYATASLPAGNTAVVSFPNTGQNYQSPLISSFSSIYSTFAENMHQTSQTSAEAAYDIWLNNWKNEVMIQHDIVNRGSCGVLANVAFGGSGGVPVQHWNLCQYGSEIIWQLTGPGERTGTVDVLAMLSWLVDHQYLPGNTNLTAISYGFELCSTGGVPETFTVSKFSIDASPR